MSSLLVGASVQPRIGLLVEMSRGFKPRGAGEITEIDADEGVCTVKWEDGVSEESIYIGQHGIFSLVTLPDDAAPRSVSSGGPEGVRPQSLAPADTAQSNTAHGAQKVLDPSRSRGHSSHGGRPEYQPMVHEKERASHASSPEVLGEPLRPRSLSPDQLAHRVGALDDARRDDVRKCLEQLCATSPNSSPRPQQRVSYHQWAQGTSGEYADTTVGMGIVGVFVEYVTLFGPASNSGKVQEGDQILSVEGESVGIDPDRLVRLISAHRGAKPLVRITVHSKMRGKQLEVDLVRWPRSQLQVYEDVEAKLEEIAAIGGSSLSADLKLLLLSVKRLEHEREVKQLQKIEQLDNRIKELEAELAKRKQIEQLHYRVKEQLEQLHNRVQELEAELTQRADEVLKEQLRVALQDCESLVTRLRQKDEEIKWMENKHVTTKALHVKELEVVAQRMLLLKEQLQANDRQLEQQGNTSANTIMVPIMSGPGVKPSMPNPNMMQSLANEAQRRLAQTVDPDFRALLSHWVPNVLSVESGIGLQSPPGVYFNTGPSPLQQEYHHAQSNASHHHFYDNHQTNATNKANVHI